MKKGIWLNETEFYEINNETMSKEEKDDADKRLQILIRFLSFFATLFMVGYFLLSDLPIHSQLRWFSILFMGSGSFMLYLICEAIIIHLFVFSNRKQLNYFYIRNKIEDSYLGISLSFIFIAVAFCVSFLIINFFNLIKFSIWDIKADIIVVGYFVLGIIVQSYFKKTKSATIELKNKNEKLQLLSKYIILYLIFINFAISFHNFQLIEQLKIMEVCIR